MSKFPAAGFSLLFLAIQCHAGNAREIPSELKRLVGQGETILDFQSADLNGDGLIDFVFIVEPERVKKNDDDDGVRILKIAIRNADKILNVVKSNDKVVFCLKCGGAFGDPFAGLTAAKKTFSVHNYGGSAWRWSYTYRFNYSKLDNTWQLVEVKESTFHASEPEKEKARTFRPPTDFGKIDISEFDPEKYKGVGKK
jgi:hypothetical protein